MKIYKPSHKLSPLAVLLLPLAVILTSVIIGLLTYGVSRLIYLPLIFPILMGLLAGTGVGIGIHLGKVRSPILAGLTTVLCAPLIYGVYYYAEYQFTFRNDLRDAFKEETGLALTDKEFEAVEELYLEEYAGETGFIGYMKLNVKEGISFTGTGSSSGSEFTVKGTGVYIYWGLELIIIAVAGYLLVQLFAKQPFSEETGEWFGKPEFLGTLRSSNFLALLDQGQFEQAGRCIDSVTAYPFPRQDIQIRRTKSPVADIALEVRTGTVNKKGAVSYKTTRVLLLTQAEFSALKTAMLSVKPG